MGELDIEDMQLTCPHHNHKINLTTGEAEAGGGVKIPCAQRVHTCRREAGELVVEIEVDVTKKKFESDRYARMKNSVWTDMHWRDIRVVH
jgi:hypothetical protein